ncbi:hypothetical protein [Streptomyces sp. NPDC096153]|uniref:hypothetical protein n=1 Tax=Streptomyces sp. NPDC096153 TaxID=3155548 RepID=UPI00331DA513
MIEILDRESSDVEYRTFGLRGLVVGKEEIVVPEIGYDPAEQVGVIKVNGEWVSSAFMPVEMHVTVTGARTENNGHADYWDNDLP